MFDSLDEQMKKDDSKTPPRQRMLLWLVIAVASVLVVGGLYFGVKLVG